MQNAISYLQQKSKSAFPLFHPESNTWFLMDSVNGKLTLPALFEQGDLIADINNLLAGTEHAYLEDVGPLLIALNHTRLSDASRHAIQRESSGIFIQSDADDILAHLQYLFIMNSDRQGLVYARYYDPVFWISAHLSLPEQHASLWGNVSRVYTPLPAGKSEAITCMEWQTPVPPAQRKHGLAKAPIRLTPEFDEISTDIKLFYFLCAQPQAIPPARLTEIIANLKILAEYGIDDSRLLEGAVDLCIAYPNIALCSDVLAILNKDSLPIQKMNDIKDFFDKELSHVSPNGTE